MRVRVQNEGERGFMTRVTNAETGEKLDLNIQELTISVFNRIPHITLTSVLPEFDIVGEAEIEHVCPLCGHQQAQEEEKEKHGSNEQ